MKKKPKKRNYKIPSKPGRRKPKFAYRDPDTLSESEWRKIDRIEDKYFVAIRNFYNSIVPEEFKSGRTTKLMRLTRTVGGASYFGIVSQGDDILFSLCGTEEVKPPEITLAKIIEDTESAINPTQREDRELINWTLSLAREEGFEPRKKKVLCVVQEKPTDFFLEKDEIVLDITDEEYRKFAGQWKYELIDFLEDCLGTADVLVKVINKINNPEAYKNYLTLKRIMDKIDEFGIIGM